MITKDPTEHDAVGERQRAQTDGSPRLVVLGRKLTARPWLLLAGAVIIIAIVWYIISRLSAGSAAPRYITRPAAYADISANVEETGTVNPVNEVDVGTQVSGTVASLNVDYNSPVHTGEVLATLDPTSFQAAAQQATGALNSAQSAAAAAVSTANQNSDAVQSAIANYQSAQAALNKAQAQVVLSNTTVARDKSLLAQGYIAQSQMDTDVAAADANDADVAAAQSAAKAAQSQIAVAQAQRQTALDQAQGAAAQITSASAQVQQANYNLARAVITSPIDGIVVARDISVGQTVAASFTTPTLFEIASSLKDMQVDTSVSEADVGQLRTGATAQITVPAYPNVIFNGTVQQVRIDPTNVSNVVTYDAVIAVHDDSMRLKPGMTADVTIAIQTAKNVLAVPAAALLFRPTGGKSASPGGGGGGFGASSASPPPIAGAPGSKAVVYVLRGSQPVAVSVVIGLSDGRVYEITSGDIKSGDQVIVGQALAHQFTTTNPLGGAFGR
jgi:HlyD family secretion protein